jgi:Flp pilus assembly protein TadG
MPRISRAGIGDFARNKRGNVAILFGLALLPLALAIGVTVDYGRALVVRERMADAADASALAIGSWPSLSEAELKTKAQQYFNANYSTSSIGATSAVQVSFPGNDIIVNVSGTVPTTFMRLANVNTIDVGASSTVTRKQRKIELALVLDTTGSMDSSGKMDAMQAAAKGMVDTLFKGDKDDVKIAVVPFSAAVNVGTANKNATWLDKGTYPNMSNVAKEDHNFNNGENAWELMKDLKNTSWNGCVRERGGSYELTDDEPNQGVKNSLFAPYFAPDEPDWDHDDGNWYSNNYIDDGDCGTSQDWRRSPRRCQKYTGKYKDASPSGDGPDENCPASDIEPLTNVQGQVVSAIETLQPKGSTVIPAGLLWGWRVLSPSAPFTEGSAYDSEKWVKAIVLLSDGQNSVGGGGNGHNNSYYNAFGYAREGHLGASNGSEAEEELDAKTLEVCSAIKAKGIQIYTIGFKITDPDTITMLKNCATEPDMAYNSPTNSQLAGIFDSIAQGLSELRIAY